MIRVCPHSDSKCPNGMACTFSCATSEYDGTKRPAAPSQTPEAAGLEDAGHIVWWKAGGVNYYPKGENFTVSASCRVEPLVTAASAQARIAELEKALERQAHNMAFLLNHAPIVQHWYEKFSTELADDRAALQQETQP